FLQFAVAQTLAGAQDSIKETVIALEVFDRKSDFDPKIDAIVRVEATKLRTRLTEFYDREGLTAPVLIEIPKGTYVPRFTLRPEALQSASVPEPTPKPRQRNLVLAASALAALIAIVVGLWFVLRTRPSTETPAI